MVDENVATEAKPPKKASKPKRTELQPWKKEISKEDYLSKLQVDGAYGSVGFDKVTDKFYEVVQDHPDRLAAVEARTQKRKDASDAHTRWIERRINAAEVRGKKEGVKEFLDGDRFERMQNAAYKRGVASTKPQMSIDAKLQKEQDKIAQAQKRMDDLKAKKAKLASPAPASKPEEPATAAPEAEAPAAE